jgi:hypothetical protein
MNRNDQKVLETKSKVVWLGAFGKARLKPMVPAIAASNPDAKIKTVEDVKVEHVHNTRDLLICPHCVTVVWQLPKREAKKKLTAEEAVKKLVDSGKTQEEAEEIVATLSF